MGDGADAIRSFAMRDGAELYYRHWPAASPRGVVVAIHGIQSHSGWYVGTCGALAAAGYETAFLDRRGSGLNKASRGDIADWRIFADDLGEFVDDARRRRAGLPVHLVAISWGAKLAVAACVRRPEIADSLVLMNPDLRQTLRRGGFLTRDARVKERKKPGLKRARKAPTYTKR